MNELEKWIVEDMIDRLDSVEDLGGYPCDLAYLLYEEDNYNGVITGYAYFSEAREWINTFWDELKEEVEDYHFNFGEYPNPFENECAFMVKIVLNAASRLITNSEWVNEHWNDDNITYTADAIKQVKAELQEAMKD